MSGVEQRRQDVRVNSLRANAKKQCNFFIGLQEKKAVGVLQALSERKPAREDHSPPCVKKGSGLGKVFWNISVKSD